VINDVSSSEEITTGESADTDDDHEMTDQPLNSSSAAVIKEQQTADARSTQTPMTMKSLTTFEGTHNSVERRQMRVPFPRKEVVKKSSNRTAFRRIEITTQR